MIDDAMTAWLGPAAEDLTDDQAADFAAAWGEIGERYPDPDDHDRRDAALSALVRYWTEEGAAERIAAETGAAYAAWQVRVAASCAAAAAMVKDGLSEREAARRSGVDRQTLRKYLGK